MGAASSAIGEAVTGETSSVGVLKLDCGTECEALVESLRESLCFRLPRRLCLPCPDIVLVRREDVWKDAGLGTATDMVRLPVKDL